MLTRALVMVVVCTSAELACTPLPIQHPLEVSAPRIAVGSAHRRAPREAVRMYAGFWRAITALDLRMGWVLADDAEQRHFADGLDAMLAGHSDTAEAVVVPLLSSSDSMVRAAARLTYGALLSADGRWNELARYADTAPRVADDSAGVERWAPAFRDVARTATFDDSVVVLPLTRSSTGTPIIPVTINGVVKRMWLDTGSSITILGSDIASECKVTPLGRDTLQLFTAVGRLPAHPALVRSLSVGGLTLTSAPAMIVRASSLRIAPGDNLAGAESAVDGVLGFDVIRLLDLTIDDAHGRVIVRRPAVRAGDASDALRNLSWFGVPIVTLRSENGVPIHLALDTGSEETFGTDALVAKTGSGFAPAERRKIRGFGGTASEPGIVVRKVRLYLGTIPLDFENLFLYQAQYPTLFSLDGTLGNDVGRGGRMRIDMTNGVLEVADR